MLEAQSNIIATYWMFWRYNPTLLQDIGYTGDTIKHYCKISAVLEVQSNITAEYWICWRYIKYYCYILAMLEVQSNTIIIVSV